MNMTVKPALYREKLDSYNVAKNGYVQIDFTPIVPKTQESTDGGNQWQNSNTTQIDNNNRKTVILTLKNLGDILSIDPRVPQTEDVFAQYQGSDNEPIKVFRISSLPDAKTGFNVSYQEIQ